MDDYKFVKPLDDEEYKLKRKVMMMHRCYKCVWSKDLGHKVYCPYGKCFYGR